MPPSGFFLCCVDTRLTHSSFDPRTLASRNEATLPATHPGSSRSDLPSRRPTVAFPELRERLLSRREPLDGRFYRAFSLLTPPPFLDSTWGSPMVPRGRRGLLHISHAYVRSHVSLFFSRCRVFIVQRKPRFAWPLYLLSCVNHALKQSKPSCSVPTATIAGLRPLFFPFHSLLELQALWESKAALAVAAYCHLLDNLVLGRCPLAALE